MLFSMKLSVVDQAPIPAGSSPTDALRNSIDLARYTEALGYTRYWIAEHHSTASLASPAPEILIARVAAETSRIRVGSGGVMLPHYSPLKVAETFRMLHAMSPGRIDLGIGRAPGGTRLDAYALRYRHNDGDDDYAAQIIELMAFLKRAEFPNDHPFGQILVTPDMEGSPDVWLLGSSGWSADAAGQLGLPYAAAHFINPNPTRASIEMYRRAWQKAGHEGEPQVLVSVGAIAAETAEEAQYHYSSQRLRRLLRDRGEWDNGPIPTPEDAQERLKTLGPSPEVPSLMADNGEWPRVFVGGTRQVHDGLSGMAEALGVDELMLITVVHSHEARKASYRLLAEAYGLSAVGAK
jgi:luciferase family oxidoreductase group 1